MKEDYAFVADTVRASGATAAIVDYALMPMSRMAVLIDQIRRASSWLTLHAGDFGGNAAALSASGHSAGAHLAFYVMARGPNEVPFSSPPLRSLLLVSGIYDLAPITESFLQAQIALTAEEVADWSPLSASPQGEVNVAVAVGERETQPFRRQAKTLTAHFKLMQIDTRTVTVPDRDHMTIMRDLGMPSTVAGQLMQECIERSRP